MLIFALMSVIAALFIAYFHHVFHIRRLNVRIEEMHNRVHSFQVETIQAIQAKKIAIEQRDAAYIMMAKERIDKVFGKY